MRTARPCTVVVIFPIKDGSDPLFSSHKLRLVNVQTHSSHFVEHVETGAHPSGQASGPKN